MYANEYCYHTYKLKCIYDNIWSVAKPKLKHNIYPDLRKKICSDPVILTIMLFLLTTKLTEYFSNK